MAQPNGQFALDQYMMHHVENSHVWHLPFIPAVPLPAPLSLHLMMILIASALLIYLFCRAFNCKEKYPRGRLTNALEAMVIFIRDEIAIETLGEEEGKKMAPLFCSLFFLILTLNLMGLIPLFSTATANYNVTGGLMLVTFFYMTVGAIRKNGFKAFCHAFVLPGLPKAILPLAIFLEIVSFFVKPFVLMLRLFANLLGGHFVLLTLTGLTVVLGLYVLPVVVPLAIFVYGLEIIVAFFQAYVFTILSATYIGQMYHPEH
ncbi:MAG: F0F1 ATP synthase subunit A [Candidatus Omnitrophica bacterium]|nr:F0F1 ATP synthase subunit A [Candidatus Omnitrophota bacterium]